MMERELEQWDYDYLLELTKSGTGESDWYEFKSDFVPANDVTATVCALANTRGGFYVLGINDDGEIPGVEANKELAHIFRKKIRADPHIHFLGPKLIPIPNNENVVPVFYIPLSSDRPHLPSIKDERVFWKRINGGKEQMTYLEILMAFHNYEERREKIKLLYVELRSNKTSLQSILESTDSEDPNEYSPSTLEYSMLNTLLVDLYSIIGKDSDLIGDLLNIRFILNAINNESKIFFRKVSIPIGSNVPKIESHKGYVRNQINRVMPLIDRCLYNLENSYGIKNPLS
jgi:hypothetical protein